MESVPNAHPVAKVGSWWGIGQGTAAHHVGQGSGIENGRSNDVEAANSGPTCDTRRLTGLWRSRRATDSCRRTLDEAQSLGISASLGALFAVEGTQTAVGFLRDREPAIRTVATIFCLKLFLCCGAGVSPR